MVKGIFTDFGIPDINFAMFTEITLSLLAIGVVLLKEVREEFSLFPRLSLKPSGHPVAAHAYIIVMIAVILLFGVLGGDQFIYFQF